MRVIKLIILFILLPVAASAQFYVTGDNPGRLRWYSINTDNFQIIYPEGSDSLARVYGYNLEKFRTPVSRTIGYHPGGPGKQRMPVVLHSYNGANGSVAWAPKRMDLYTIPSLYDNEAMLWPTMLSVHESRHVSQMQFGLQKAHKPFYWFFGEMWNGLAAQLYIGISNLEGDAVIAETALTNSGRGRTADFLNYYKVAFDNGDFRKWSQWRFMSQHNYSPDHYALGYLTLGGLRFLHDTADFINDINKLVTKNPLRLDGVYTTVRKKSGKKFDDAFQEVCDTLHKIWSAETQARGPFMYIEAVTTQERLYTKYSRLAFLNDDLYAVKSGLLTSSTLVKINNDGSEERIGNFASESSQLKASDKTGRLYWTESISDPRWSMKMSSQLRYLDPYKLGKKNLTTKDSSLVFNPDIHPESLMIATVSYDFSGKAQVHIINGINGKTVREIDAPEGLQPVETAWLGQTLYTTMIDANGIGIWKYEDGWKKVLKSEPVKIKDFGGIGDKLAFTCDKTGVNEVYHFDPNTGELTQKTITRYGASDFAYSQDGKWLYFTSQTIDGMHVFRTPTDSLINRTADFSEKHKWTLAEKLTEQERSLAAKEGYDSAVTDVNPTFSEPKRYRKFPHAFNIHSWAPFYVNVDNIMNMSYDYSWQAISLGASAIMQNRLSTFVGEVGYSAHKDPYQPEKWRHSGHVKFTYSGWYPVIEFSADFNDRSAIQTSVEKWTDIDLLGQVEKEYYLINSTLKQTPYIKGKLSVYIPLNFSQGGTISGFIPKISYTASNDMYDNNMESWKWVWNLKDVEGSPTYVREDIKVGETGGANKFQQTITASLRGYTMTSVPSSAVYPRWGIGGEIGYMIGLDNKSAVSPMEYLYSYAYTPGIIRSHGIKLGYTFQRKSNPTKVFSQPIVNILPRGFNADYTVMRNLTNSYSMINKFSIDYAAPIYIGDISLGGTLLSIKRLIFTPHFDYTIVMRKGDLFSAGANLILDLNSILWLEYPCSFGLTFSYNGGTFFNNFTNGSTVGKYYIGPTFNVSF